MSFEDKRTYDEEQEGLYEYEYAVEDESGEESDIALTLLGTYDGKRNNKNERHGFGKAILPNGDAYVGTYKNGFRHGYGQYRFKNGAKYQGCYKHGLRNGKGVMSYPDKSKYEGYWTNNDRDGDGILTFENNDVFEGMWKSDMKHGLGTYTYCKTGAILKGMWHNDKKHGNFQIFFPTSVGYGFTFHGTWDKEEVITGEGYFVFDNLACMQRGVHVVNPIPKKPRSTKAHHKTKSIWYSFDILPIISSMLPRPPVARPMLNKKQSCELDDSVTEVISTDNITKTTSHMETYECKDNLWNEMNEFEIGEGLTELENEDGFDSKTSRIYRTKQNNF